jgi:hypothetical protein
MTRFNFQEAFQDAILSVKKLQQVVCKKYGLKSLPSKEDAWTYENRLQSINMRERKHFINEIYEKMMKVHDKLIKNGATVDEINEYVICKHGLERNRVFAERDAQNGQNALNGQGARAPQNGQGARIPERDYAGRPFRARRHRHRRLDIASSFIPFVSYRSSIVLPFYEGKQSKNDKREREKRTAPHGRVEVQ